MTKSTDNNLMALLGKKAGGTDTWTALAAKAPAHEPAEPRSPEKDAKLQQLLQRINQLTTPADPRKTASPTAALKPSTPEQNHATATGAAPAAAEVDPSLTDDFLPIEPPTVRDAGLTDSEVEALPLKSIPHSLMTSCRSSRRRSAMPDSPTAKSKRCC
jgi:hypothetical protein